jgi:hypothetical protein
MRQLQRVVCRVKGPQSCLQTRYQAMILLFGTKLIIFILQVIKETDWAGGETIDAQEKNMVYDVHVHKKYHAKYYWDKDKTDQKRQV